MGRDRAPVIPWPWLARDGAALVGASPPVADIGAQRRSRVSQLPRAPEAAFESTGGGQLVAFVAGMDAAARPMSDAEAAQKLRDPFATLVLRRGVFPRTLAEVLKALNDQNGDSGSVPQQRNFLVGEGSQIAFDPSATQPNRALRYVIARARAGDTRVLISTAAGGPPGGFLQLIAWDADAGAFNFYERPGRGDLVLDRKLEGGPDRPDARPGLLPLPRQRRTRDEGAQEALEQLEVAKCHRLGGHPAPGFALADRSNVPRRR